jgi:acyl dehydratase
VETIDISSRAFWDKSFPEREKSFARLSARFAAPVLPGQTLTVLIWAIGDDHAVFQTRVGATVVLDRGMFTRRSQ